MGQGDTVLSASKILEARRDLTKIHQGNGRLDIVHYLPEWPQLLLIRQRKSECTFDL